MSKKSIEEPMMLFEELEDENSEAGDGKLLPGAREDDDDQVIYGPDQKLLTLYKRRSDKGLQQWSIEMEGDKYRTVSGTVDGEKVTSAWTVCKPKNVGRQNATTPEQQAKSEAESQWIKKRDEYALTKDDVDNVGYFKPMLALKWDDCKADVKYPIWCQPKLDGMRCIASAKGMYSRKGKPIISAPHVLEALQPLLKKYPALVFDGELYCDKLKDDFNQIISLVKKTKPTKGDLDASRDMVQYWIYDLPSHPGKFSERSAELQKLIQELNQQGRPVAVFVPTFVVFNLETQTKFYEDWLEKGFEGQMVRIDAPYENKRTKILLKRKEFHDDEFEVIEVLEGVGNRAGMAGSLNVKGKNGKIFNTNIKGGNSFYKDLWRDKDKLVGKTVTVRYQNLTPDEIPRFPFCVAVRDYE